MNSKKKIIIAMSGGVDSSVAAALLKKEGHAVVGVFLQFWKKGSGKIKLSNKTFAVSERACESARKVAEFLGIEFEVVNVSEKFEKCVISYFLEEYKNGRTPNPCVVCNVELKLAMLIDELKKQDADLAATGHYAQIVEKDKRYCLIEGLDELKDQSYFLYRLNQKQLGSIIFPLGKYTKEEVKKLAKKMNLPIMTKGESQDVCFIQGMTVADFLKENISMQPGNIVNERGEIIGKHLGLPLYTLGQRKGINIGGSGPYYVTGKDLKKNELFVTNNSEEGHLLSKEMRVEDVSWIVSEPNLPLKCQMRTRYQKKKVYGTIEKRGELYYFKFEKPQEAVTPGQSAVFYDKKEVLGGGTIK